MNIIADLVDRIKHELDNTCMVCNESLEHKTRMIDYQLCGKCFVKLIGKGAK